MKVHKARAAELSDYEVLSVLREMDKRQQSAQDTASSSVNVSKGAPSMSVEERVLQNLPANLRTIQYEVLETLQNVQRPCAHQSAEQIPRFLDALSAWERGRPVEGVATLNEGHDAFQFGDEDGVQPPGSTTMPRAAIEPERRLTKGERLMLINHAPATQIELYTLVEALETRFDATEIADLLAIVAAHLPLDPEAMRADQTKADAAAAASTAVTAEEQDGVDEHAFEAAQEDDIVDPDEEMELMENERPGGLAVEEEAPDE